MNSSIWNNGPFIAYWNITSKCNLSCQHCHVGNMQHNHYDLNTRQCLTIVNKLADADVKVIIVSGGEPLLRKDIWEIMSAIKSQGLRLFLASNGYLIELNTLHKLVELHIDELQISLDSHRRNVHDNFRGLHGSFDKALNAIKLCLNANVPVGVNTVITANNLDDLQSMGAMLENMGVKYWRVTINVPKGRGADAFSQLQVEDSKLFEKIQLLTHTYHNVIIDDPLCVKFWRKKGQVAKQCGAGKILCSIESDGIVKPCVFIEDSFGSILNTSLLEIWNSEKMVSFRDEVSLSPDCEECEVYSKCRGGCKAFLHYFKGQGIVQRFCF